MQRELRSLISLPVLYFRMKWKNRHGSKEKNYCSTYFYRTLSQLLFIQLDGSCLLVLRKQRKTAHIFLFFLQGEKVNYEKFRVWLLHNKDAFTFSRWLLSGGVYVTLTDDSDTPTFYQTLAGVTHCK